MNQGDTVFLESHDSCYEAKRSWYQQTYSELMDTMGSNADNNTQNGIRHAPPWRTFLDTNTPLLERLQAAATKLLEAVDNALLGDRQSAESCADQASAMLRGDSATHSPAALSVAAHSSASANNLSPAEIFVSAEIFSPTKTWAPANTLAAKQPINKATPLIRGGLAPWQVRQIAAYIDANLGANVSTADLAKVVRLSPCHFSRAFRESFGASPHKYVMRKRVERAQGLMLTTSESLGQIAVECGLADQAHLCKLFLKIAGESPGMWRRARASQPA